MRNYCHINASSNSAHLRRFYASQFSPGLLSGVRRQSCAQMVVPEKCGHFWARILTRNLAKQMSTPTVGVVGFSPKSDLIYGTRFWDAPVRVKKGIHRRRICKRAHQRRSKKMHGVCMNNVFTPMICPVVLPIRLGCSLITAAKSNLDCTYTSCMCSIDHLAQAFQGRTILNRHWCHSAGRHPPTDW